MLKLYLQCAVRIARDQRQGLIPVNCTCTRSFRKKAGSQDGKNRGHDNFGRGRKGNREIRTENNTTAFLRKNYGITSKEFLTRLTDNKFDEYLPMKKVKKSLKDGTLIEGTLRINKKNVWTVFVVPLDGSPDIFIPDSFYNKNRALHQDIVAVQIVPNTDEAKKPASAVKEATDDLNDEAIDAEGGDEIQELRNSQRSRCGKVVSILEKKHPRLLTGLIDMKSVRQYPFSRIIFIPTDPALPKMSLDISDLPSDIIQQQGDYSKTLYVAEMIDWKSTDVFASGKLVKSLGDAEGVEAMTMGILTENQVDSGKFSDQVLNCLPKNSPWHIPPKEFEYRQDFRDSCIFTIDPSTARDIDDALSCEALGNGQYKVGVHIADVSYFVKQNTALDLMASQRSTSHYLVQKAIPMLPELLSEELCSLNPDVDRLAFSLEWIITEDGEILKEWYGRSVIKSCVKLNYDQAQVFIDQPTKEWSLDELPPISKPYNPNDLGIRIRNLQKLAVRLRKGRFDSGSLKLDKIKLQFSLDKDTGLPNGCFVYEHKDSNRLIEEFMLLANMTVAKIIKKKYPQHAVLRRHEPPKQDMLEKLKSTCLEYGIDIDISSAGSIQRSLENFEGQDFYSKSKMEVLVTLCTKPLKLAQYFCAGTLEEDIQSAHYALNVPLYTHFTSPIRRYPDILVHRLLGATLGYSDPPSYKPSTVQKTLVHSNLRREASKKVDEKSRNMFFAAFLKKVGPITEKAMVMTIKKNSIDIFVLRYGVTKNVYFMDLPTKLRAKHKVDLRNIDVKSAPKIVDIKLFTVLDCELKYSTTKIPFRWEATILVPERDSETDIVNINNSSIETNDSVDKS